MMLRHVRLHRIAAKFIMPSLFDIKMHTYTVSSRYNCQVLESYQYTYVNCALKTQLLLTPITTGYTCNSYDYTVLKHNSRYGIHVVQP